MFIKKLLSVFLLVLVSLTVKIDAKIPNINGLHNILKQNDIGFGQALLYSNFIKKTYISAKKEDLVGKLVRILWEIKADISLKEATNRDLDVSDGVIASFLDAENFGILMGYVYSGDLENAQKYDSSVKTLREKFEKERLNDLDEFLKVLVEAIMDSKKTYMPRIVEALLWAFFEHKNEDLKTALVAISQFEGKSGDQDRSIFNNEYMKKIYDDRFYLDLYADSDLDIFEQEVKKSNNQLEYVEKNYDKALHCLMKMISLKVFPPIVDQIDTNYKKYSSGFPTCFETSIIDLVSILLYNPKTEQYDDSILPESVRSAKGFLEFKEFLKKPSDIGKNQKKLIDEGNKVMYKAKDLDFFQKNKYELNTNLGNFISIMNYIYGFEQNKSEGKNICSDKVIIENFGSKLSIPKRREVSFKVEECFVGFQRKGGKKVPYSTGNVHVTIKDLIAKCSSKIILEVYMYAGTSTPGHAELNRVVDNERFRDNVYAKKTRESLSKEVEKNTDKYNKFAPFFMILGGKE